MSEIIVGEIIVKSPYEVRWAAGAGSVEGAAAVGVPLVGAKYYTPEIDTPEISHNFIPPWGASPGIAQPPWVTQVRRDTVANRQLHPTASAKPQGLRPPAREVAGAAPGADAGAAAAEGGAAALRADLACGQHGVNTSGAAAKVMNLDRLGKKVRPGTFGKMTVG